MCVRNEEQGNDVFGGQAFGGVRTMVERQTQHMPSHFYISFYHLSMQIKTLIKALAHFPILSPQCGSCIPHIIIHHYQTFSGNKT